MNQINKQVKTLYFACQWQVAGTMVYQTLLNVAMA